MSAERLSSVLAAARAEGRAALVAYLPVGYPDLPTSLEAMRALVDAGADVVEVGVPYSDPLMDGPVIQAAAVQALAGGTRLRHSLEAAGAVADAGGCAVLMSYWNPVLAQGVETFARRLAEAGGSGLITPDLTPDEAGPWRAAARAHGMAPVFLVAPSSTDARLAATVEACEGFVYAASTMGVTGARSEVGSAAPRLVDRVRRTGTDLPVCVGLGVSTREQAAEVAGFADGVIVGSALVRALGEGGVGAVHRLAAELAAGVRAGRA